MTGALMTRAVRIIGLVAALAILVAACGDSGSPVEDALAEESANDLFSGDDSGTIPATIGDIPGIDDECEAIANVFLAMASVLSGQSVDMSAFDALPSSLEADAQVVVEAFDDYADGLAELGIDLNDPEALANLSPSQLEGFNQLAEQVDSDALNAAMDNLSAYGEAQCGQLDS